VVHDFDFLGINGLAIQNRDHDEKTGCKSLGARKRVQSVDGQQPADDRDRERLQKQVTAMVFTLEVPWQ